MRADGEWAGFTNEDNKVMLGMTLVGIVRNEQQAWLYARALNRIKVAPIDLVQVIIDMCDQYSPNGPGL